MDYANKIGVKEKMESSEAIQLFYISVSTWHAD